MRFTKSLLSDLCYEDPTYGMNTVISDWEIYVAKEKRPRKLKGKQILPPQNAATGAD